MKSLDITNTHELLFDEDKHRYTLDGNHVPGVTTFCKGGYPTSEALISWMKSQTGNAVWDTLLKKDSDGYKPKTNIVWPLSEVQRKEIIKEAKAKDKEESEKAAAVGIFVHDFAYLTETGQAEEAYNRLDEAKKLLDWEKIKAGIDKFTDWKRENKDEMVASESIVASTRYSFGGKFDRLANRNNSLVLSDFKTASGIWLDHKIQLAAYRLAIREWMGLNVDAIEVLRFGKEEGEFETELINDSIILQDLENQAIRCRETYKFRLQYESKYPKKKKSNG